MALTLAIIAVLAAAVLQSRALIENAEYKSFRQNLIDYAHAFGTFRERYDDLPGDFARAVDLGLASGAGGNGNGLIDNGASCDEGCTAWRHLRGASLISCSGPTAPEHSYGGTFSRFESGSYNGGDDFGHLLVVLGVPVQIARRLDKQIDDGACNDGRVTGVADALPGAACSGPDWDESVETVAFVYAL